MVSQSDRSPTVLIWIRNAMLFFLAITITSFVYAFQIEPNWFEVVPINLTIPELASAFDGFKIVQISDIHADTSMNSIKLSRIAKIVNQQKPDIIAITGDFISYKTDPITIKLLKEAFEQLTPKDKTVAVLGNHDYFVNPANIRKLLQESNILELGNKVYTIKRGQDKLSIAGVDDILGRQSRLDLVLKELPSDSTAILLVHEPDFADISASKERFVLQISGHSHGGQVRLPFGKAPVLPIYGKKYPAGLYYVGTMLQYTNRGLGMGIPALRFNCRPEITVFTLHSY